MSVFEFASGLRLLDPVPNNGNGTGEVLVGDFDRPNGPDWGLGGRGTVEADTVPDGSAYIGRNIAADATLSFGFDQKVFSASARVTSTDGVLSGRVAATAYDAGGKPIAGARIAGVEVDDWDTNVISVTSKVPIARVVFTGDFLVVDQVSFDTSKPKVVKGTKGNDKIGSANGKSVGDSADLVLGKNGNDKVFARGGDDTLAGGKGKDKLHGGDGNDLLIGGVGKDKLWGDAGQDSYLFRELDAVDALKNFSPTDDSILLARSTFTELALGTLKPEQFNNGSAPLDADDRIVFDSASGALSYDPDGSGGQGAIQFAKLTPGLAVTSDNFFVV